MMNTDIQIVGERGAPLRPGKRHVRGGLEIKKETKKDRKKERMAVYIKQKILVTKQHMANVAVSDPQNTTTISKILTMKPRSKRLSPKSRKAACDMCATRILFDAKVALRIRQ